MKNNLPLTEPIKAKIKVPVPFYQSDFANLNGKEAATQIKINNKLKDLKTKFDNAADRSIVNSSTISGELTAFLQRDVGDSVGMGTRVFEELSNYLHSDAFYIDFPQQSQHNNEPV